MSAGNNWHSSLSFVRICAEGIIHQQGCPQPDNAVEDQGALVKTTMGRFMSVTGRTVQGITQQQACLQPDNAVEDQGALVKTTRGRFTSVTGRTVQGIVQQQACPEPDDVEDRGVLVETTIGRFTSMTGRNRPAARLPGARWWCGGSRRPLLVELCPWLAGLSKESPSSKLAWSQMMMWRI